MNVDFYIWRIVLEGLAPLSEIREKWNICDLADAHEVLDIKAEAEAHYSKEAERRSKTKAGRAHG